MMKNILLMIFAFCMLSACTAKRSDYLTANEEIQLSLHDGIKANQSLVRQGNATLPKNVNSALLPPLAVQLPAAMSAPEEKRFDVSAKELPARDFFMGLVAGTPYNMLVDPATTGTITLELKNVTIEEALDAAQEMYGYEYQKTAYGFEILPQVMKTQMFPVNYLNMIRTGKSKIHLLSTEITSVDSDNNSNSGGTQQPTGGTNNGSSENESSSTITTSIDNDLWGELSTALKALIGNKDGRWVVVNPEGSIVMVHAYPNELHQVADYLDAIQNNIQRQVIIEAKILEVQLSDSYQAGINWTALTASQGAGAVTPIDSSGGIFSLALSGDHGNFSSIINLLEEQGNVQVLSSPHIATANNQQAMIKVGNDEFFVTGFTSNITPSSGTNTTSQSVALNPFFSGITLNVTPQISSNDEVVLAIHPSITEVKDQVKTIQMGSGAGNAITIPLARSTIRESDNIVRAKSGQIIVIGGLMQNLTAEQIAATPGLSKIPFVGAVGRNTAQASTKNELVILLRPIVTNDKTWSDRMQTSEDHFKQLDRGFHVGSRPEIFGTKAEANP